MRFTKFRYKGTSSWTKVISGEIPITTRYENKLIYGGMNGTNPILMNVIVYSGSGSERMLYFTASNKGSSDLVLSDMSFSYPVKSL